jgi:hypothetical protein
MIELSIFISDSHNQSRLLLTTGCWAGIGGYTYTDTKETTMIPMPVKICWNLFSRRMFRREVMKKKRLQKAAHFTYKKMLLKSLKSKDMMSLK